MERKKMNLVWLMVGVGSADLFAGDVDDANVKDVNWRETQRVGVSDDAGDGKMTMMTNAFDLMLNR